MCVNEEVESMKYLKQSLEVGDVLKLGELTNVKIGSSTQGVSLEAISQGEESEYVVLKTSDLQRGEEVDVHPDVEVLGLSDGQGIAGQSLWYVIPKEVYQ